MKATSRHIAAPKRGRKSSIWRHCSGGTITIATLRNAPLHQSNFQGKLVVSPARPEPSGFGLVNGAEHGFFLDLLIS